MIAKGLQVIVNGRTDLSFSVIGVTQVVKKIARNHSALFQIGVELDGFFEIPIKISLTGLVELVLERGLGGMGGKGE
jgi:hypothetical protein